MTDQLRLSLEAVVVAVTDDRPRVLTVEGEGGHRLPSGDLDVEADATLALAMRRLIAGETGLQPEYLEQLYTFGDRNRHRRRQPGEPRAVGVAYLVLARESPTAAHWIDWYHLFPWEDHRAGRPDVLTDLDGRLAAWAAGDSDRIERIQVAFGVGETPWDPVRALDRYELLYETRLVAEWAVDHDEAPGDRIDGVALAYDHRRVVATAMSRLRGKLTYRPVVFDLLPETFTLSHLQRTVEALAGATQHTQNFRRLVESQGLVEGTGRYATTGGRPAELFRFRRGVLLERPRAGLSLR